MVLSEEFYQRDFERFRELFQRGQRRICRANLDFADQSLSCLGRSGEVFLRQSALKSQSPKISRQDALSRLGIPSCHSTGCFTPAEMLPYALTYNQPMRG